MPITYTINKEERLVCVELSGVPTAQETVDYFDRLRSDSNCPENGIEIVDFTAVKNLDAGPSDARWAAQTYALLKSSKCLLATVVLVDSEVMYGMSRMMQTRHGMTDPPHEMHIARSKEEVLTMIREIRSTGRMQAPKITEPDPHRYGAPLGSFFL
jgi:hypothetical protein